MRPIPASANALGVRYACTMPGKLVCEMTSDGLNEKAEAVG